MDKTVDLNYSWEYGSNFDASPELQTMVSGWYSNGTEIMLPAALVRIVPVRRRCRFR